MKSDTDTVLKKIASCLEEYTVILEPDEKREDWWAGAPSVVIGPDGYFYLAARMREGNSPRGRRGYEVRILKSSDGVKFDRINSIRRQDLELPVVERAAIVYDGDSGKYRLYGCSAFFEGWGIWKLRDEDNPEKFDAKTVERNLNPPIYDDNFVHVRGYKDPFIIKVEDMWNMFVIGIDRVERPYRFTSKSGDNWKQPKEEPILDSYGWHNFFTRPACLLPLDNGYLFVYEGSSILWRDPVYNIATGLAFTYDLEEYTDLTPKNPLLKSTTPGDYHTWRYSHWIRVKDEIFVYYEAANPDNTNEVRLGIIDFIPEIAPLS